MSTLQAQLVPFIAGLTKIHHLEHRRDAIIGLFRTLTAAYGSWDPGSGAERRRSTLTHDGFPLEVSVSLGQKETGGVRYGLEAGNLSKSFRERLEEGNNATVAALSRIGADGQQITHRSLLDIVFPASVKEAANCRFGLWHAVAHKANEPDVLKVYYNVSHFRQRASAVLRECLRVLGDSVTVQPIHDLPTQVMSSPVFFGVEYNGSHFTKVKVYYRFTEHVEICHLHDLLLSTGFTDHIPSFERIRRSLFGEGPEYPRRSIMYYVGLEPTAVSLSIYFALNHFFGRAFSLSKRVTDVLVSLLNSDPSPYQETLRVVSRGQSTVPDHRYHTMIGVGFGCRGPKINVYLKPSWRDLGEPVIPNPPQSHPSSSS